jgi:hypothetical protein
MAGDYFPQNYKEFPYKEGDLLAGKREDGKYSVNKVLKIDQVALKKGDTINIQGQIFTAPEEDFLLIISMSYGESEFDSIEEAKKAALAGSWNVSMAHAPNRPPGAAIGQTYIGNAPVKEDELSGYYHWKELFVKGKAGVF